MPEIITMLRMKSMTLSMIANEIVSFSNPASLCERRSHRSLVRRRVAAPDPRSSKGHEDLSGFHALVYFRGDMGNLARDLRHHLGLHLHCFDGRYLVAD